MIIDDSNYVYTLSGYDKEDSTSDDEVSRRIPILRRVQLHRDADKRREEEMEYHRKIARDVMFENNQEYKRLKKTGGEMNIADMNITFDHYGRMIRLNQPNPDKMADISKYKSLIKSKIDEKVEVIQQNVLGNSLKDDEYSNREMITTHMLGSTTKDISSTRDTKETLNKMPTQTKLQNMTTDASLEINMNMFQHQDKNDERFVENWAKTVGEV